jgi:opacity protein-like surface antigen
MKYLTTIALAAILGGIPIGCLADGGTFFVNADAGQANYHIDSQIGSELYPFGDSLNDSAAAGAVRFGYRWHNVMDYGIEAGYADLGQINSTVYPQYGGKYQTDLKDRGWLLGGDLKYNFDSNWYVSARGGWFRAQIDDKGSATLYLKCPPGVFCPFYVGFQQYNDSRTGNGEYLGAGAGYNFSTNFSLGLGYDYYRSDRMGNGSRVDVGLYSLSAEYRF